MPNMRNHSYRVHELLSSANKNSHQQEPVSSRLPFTQSTPDVGTPWFNCAGCSTFEFKPQVNTERTLAAFCGPVLTALEPGV